MKLWLAHAFDFKGPSLACLLGGHSWMEGRQHPFRFYHYCRLCSSGKVMCNYSTEPYNMRRCEECDAAKGR